LTHDVVIIYSKADKATAEAVCHRLESTGIRCWIAPRDIGDDRGQDEAIVQALGESKLAIMVVSSPADPARQVMTAALDAEIMIIPFRAEIQSPSQMISRHLHWLDVLSEPLDARIRQLIDRVTSHLSGQETRPVEP
jgi:hypothetical protein